MNWHNCFFANNNKIYFDAVSDASSWNKRGSQQMLWQNKCIYKSLFENEVISGSEVCVLLCFLLLESDWYTGHEAGQHSLCNHIFCHFNLNCQPKLSQRGWWRWRRETDRQEIKWVKTTHFSTSYHSYEESVRRLIFHGNKRSSKRRAKRNWTGTNNPWNRMSVYFSFSRLETRKRI